MVVQNFFKQRENRPVDTMPFEKISLFGTATGIEQLIRIVPRDRISAIVAPSIRQHEVDQIGTLIDGMAIPFFIQPTYKSEEYKRFYNEISSLGFDSIISNAYSMIIRPDILDLCKYYAVNIHWSLLPENRGPNPVQWALIKDQKKTGITAHFIDNGIDTGDIILARDVPISDEDTWVSLSAKLYDKSEDLIEKTLQLLFAGNYLRLRQDNSQSSQNSRITPEFPQIDFTKMSDRAIFNLIRAQIRPLGGAYVVRNDNRIYFPEYVEYNKIKELRDKYGK